MRHEKRGGRPRKIPHDPANPKCPCIDCRRERGEVPPRKTKSMSKWEEGELVAKLTLLIEYLDRILLSIENLRLDIAQLKK